MRLIHEKTGQPLNIGDPVVTFRGERGVLTGSAEPRHSGSTGRVCLRLGDADGSAEFFPSVIDAKWVAE